MRKIGIFLEMIKFEHTLFALPFAYFGAFLASNGLPTFEDFFWITMAMVGARTAAMSLNRVIDRFIDARNPRTANRAIPAGLIGIKEVYLSILFSFLLLAFSAYKLNMLAFKLMPLAVFVLVIYSYTKRFTWACHLVLGLALGIAPVGAWIGVTGYWGLPPVVLAVGVILWVAGFDIIYACQDEEFDRTEGLFSIPAVFGIHKALKFSELMHLAALLFFILTGIISSLGIVYYIGVAVSAVLLYRQHRLVSPVDLSRVGVAFFNLNAYLSLVLFVFASIDLVFFK